MPKIRLLEPAFRDLTGYFGRVEFENGVSVESLSDREAARIAGIIQAETIDGNDPNSDATYIAHFNTPLTDDGQSADQPVGDAPTITYDYTRQSLEEVADKLGIKGLREIADKYGVKNNSIVGLIKELLVLSGEEMAD